MKQVWKLPFNPVGYDPVSYTIVTFGGYVGKTYTLKHSYFSSDNIRVTDDSKNVYTISDTDQSADILLVNEFVSFTKLSGKKVYQNIKLNSERVLNKNLTLWASYIADVISPEDIGQAVHPDADVFHRSIDTFESFTAVGTSGYFEVLYHLDLPDGGFINETGAHFKGETLAIGGTTLNQKGIDFSDKPTLSYKDDSLSFNGVHWEHITKGDAKALLAINASKSEVREGLLFWSKNAPGASTLVPWIKLSSKDESMSIPKLATKDLKTDMVSLGDFQLKILPSGDLSIADVITINKETKKVSIGSVVFNKELIELLDFVKSLKNGAS